MDKETRNLISSTTQAIRRLLEEEFSLQLEGAFDIHDDGRIAADAGPQLTQPERFTRQRIVEAIQHRRAVGESAAESIRGFRSEAVFTCFNRLAALRMMEARGLVLPCVSQGDQSQGFKEFSGLAPGLVELPDKGYRLYLECLFDEIGREVGVLFDRTDAASQLWPRRKALEAVLAKLNTPELAGVWAEDETIGWIYQYFNDEAERKKMREESSAPRNSRELAVRNQFFTPRYVVEFLTDNTLGRLWYEMTRGETTLRDRCRYLVRRPTEIFLKPGEFAPESAAGSEAKAGENLSQEELLRQPVPIPHRPLKDPREIRLLDPACGSMHFGLYAFDLFTVIYDEAWEIAHGPDDDAKSAETFASFVTFAAAFPDKAAFLREVPRLIVEHNIHGIDIDPRAAQIAGLSLWLRAQRAWHQAGVKPADRPRITRSNIVCAEPMPGEKELLSEFVHHQFPAGERPIFQHFLESIFEKMKLAGEAGSLLRIEEEIRTAIDEARTAWAKIQSRPLELFSTSELNRISSAPELTGLESALTGNSRTLAPDYWTLLEQRIYDALEAYAAQAEGGGGFQRRLFANDAAQGFAFIDLCRKRYDVVVMNPPFGLLATSTKEYLFRQYPTAKEEIMNAMILASVARLNRHGMLGCIGNRTVFFLANHEEWRRELFESKAALLAFGDLGHGVLDGALVETAAFVLHAAANLNQQSIFVTALSATDKQSGLTDALERFRSSKPQAGGFFVRRLKELTAVPGFRLAYAVPQEFLHLFATIAPLDPKYGEVIVGLQTSDNDRFLRLAWEIDAEAIGQTLESLASGNGAEWAYFAKGGEYSPYFADIHLVCEWRGDGAVMKAFASALYGHWSHNIHHPEFYFRPGLTFSRRTASSFNPRVLPAGCLFGEQGPTIFPMSAFEKHPLAMLAICHSRVFQAFVELLVASGDTAFSGSAARTYERGVIGRVPLICPSEEHLSELSEPARRAANAQRIINAQDETSRFFVCPPSVFGQPSAVTTFSKLSAESETRLAAAHLGCLEATAEVERLVSELYNFHDATRDWIESEFGPHPNGLSAHSDGTSPALTDFRRIAETDETKVIDALVDSRGGSRFLTKKAYFSDRRLELLCIYFGLSPREVVRLCKETGTLLFTNVGDLPASILSYAGGAAFGRWDIRYATGERLAPELPDPFAPLPVCPLGMLQGDDGLPLSPEAGRRLRTEGRYPLDVAWDGILVDDPDHLADVVGRVQEVLRVLWKDRADAIEHEACELLGMKSLRDWFRKPTGFFADHLKRYSKSRRQAPIYWPLSSPNGLYTVWLYYHRLTADSLFTVLRDHLKPKLEFEERRAFQLRQEAGTTPSPSQRRDIAEAEELVEDLRAFKAELERVAPLFRPNLNDGVIINCAPLWRVIGLPKWRKDCQAIWNELAKGDYHWAHLAMHLWPERVVPKCATDRSLAIAHGLEEVFWREDPEKPGKWIARKVTELELRGLIAERTSAAVKAAVESLVGATSNEGAPRRGRKGTKA